MPDHPRVCVFGAGSIGCFVGGCLAAAGSDVRFVGRERLAKEIARHGLRLSDWRGRDQRLSADALHFATTSEPAADADLVLVTVKSAGTAQVAAELAGVLPPHALVISLQNGLHNADVLRAALPRHAVLAGMVPFNVVQRGGGAFHAGSEGTLEVERHPALGPFLAEFERAGLPLLQHDDIPAVQWAKLLLNLNNAINALADLPLKEQVSRRSFRRCLALAQREALGILAAHGVRPARLTPVPPSWIPRMLELPDGLFRAIAGRMMAFDPLALTSMWEDLQAGRPTEVEYLNGEIVRLAGSLGRRAPINARLTALIHEAEAGRGHAWSGEDLLEELRRA